MMRIVLNTSNNSSFTNHKLYQKVYGAAIKVTVKYKNISKIKINLLSLHGYFLYFVLRIYFFKYFVGENNLEKSVLHFPSLL